jgi:hypothetical protein
MSPASASCTLSCTYTLNLSFASARHQRSLFLEGTFPTLRPRPHDVTCGPHDLLPEHAHDFRVQLARDGHAFALARREPAWCARNRVLRLVDSPERLLEEVPEAERELGLVFVDAGCARERGVPEQDAQERLRKRAARTGFARDATTAGDHECGRREVVREVLRGVIAECNEQLAECARRVFNIAVYRARR